MAKHDRMEDVIELGSSDEEPEPVPKKVKISKPMVQIPQKLPGITIKPAKLNPVKNLGKSITVTKVVSSGTKVANPFANKNKQNGKPNQKVVQQPVIKSVLPVIHPSLTITQAKKNNTVPTPYPIKISKAIISGSSKSSKSPALKTKLPPGIILKKANQLVKNVIQKNPVNYLVGKKPVPLPSIKPIKIQEPAEMVCVDLDDDESSQPASSHQWYLRPEEQEKKCNFSESKELDSKDSDTNNKTSTSPKDTPLTNSNDEDLNSHSKEQNNKETANFIEITIEDSPSKPKKSSKRPRKMSELAITIEDSPVKPATDTAPTASNSSDDESPTKKKSKKKLQYPQTETVEIEIELTPVNDEDEQNVEKLDADTEIVEIEESPLKPLDSDITSTPKKKEPKSRPTLQLHVNKTPGKSQKDAESSKVTPKPITTTPITLPGEFHPMFQSFIDLCFKLENSQDMNTIVEKKIKGYYRQVPKEYTESEEFIEMVSSKIDSMKADPEKLFWYIKDIVDELNLQRKMAKSQPPKLDVVSEEPEKVLYGEESEFNSKRQRQIKKLEKTLKKLHKAIQKLEEQEVDFDDEEDSVYLLTERYKERMMKVHAKFCQLTNTKMPSEPRVKIEARPGQPKGPAIRLEKWINKKVPIGTPLPFPDFHDVLRCVRDANKEDNIGWNEVDVMEEARDLFTRCGKKLQRRRQENEWRLVASRIQAQLDPAEESEDLKKKLDMNQRTASTKESEVLKKYADRQNQLKLEAVEIEDKEADESPLETDDEEQESEEKPPLEDAQKRKERLKRLLQKKPKKSTTEKELTKKSKEAGNEKTDTTVPNENAISNIVTQVVIDKEKDVLEKKDKNVVEPKINEKANENPIAVEYNNEKNDIENVQLLSDDDDSSNIDSDIDELHLLQKLPTNNVVDVSSLESSDSESIAISDTLSSGDNENREFDVISIENSTPSESENNDEIEFEPVSCTQSTEVSEPVDVEMEIECPVDGIEKELDNSTNSNESVEDNLLASSDEEEQGENENDQPKTKDFSAEEEVIGDSEITELNKEQIQDVTDIMAHTTDASSKECPGVPDAHNLNKIVAITSVNSVNEDDKIGNTNRAASNNICVKDILGKSESEEDKTTESVEINMDITSESSGENLDDENVNTAKATSDINCVDDKSDKSESKEDETKISEDMGVSSVSSTENANYETTINKSVEDTPDESKDEKTDVSEGNCNKTSESRQNEIDSSQNFDNDISSDLHVKHNNEKPIDGQEIVATSNDICDRNSEKANDKMGSEESCNKLEDKVLDAIDETNKDLDSTAPESISSVEPMEVDEDKT